MTKTLSYGVAGQTIADTPTAIHVEALALKGYTVIPDLIEPKELATWRKKVDDVYAEQVAEFGLDTSEAMGEVDLCRAPLLYDFDFLKLAEVSGVLAVVAAMLGDWFILNLQNAVINRPNISHHQTAWHRDLPYQNFVISKPLAINALFALDEFSADTGATFLLPFSHKHVDLPSAAYLRDNAVSVAASPGSAILFDAVMFYRAGANSSAKPRRAINHLYIAPIIKQQYDFPNELAAIRGTLSAESERPLGFTSTVPRNAQARRQARKQRIGRSN